MQAPAPWYPPPPKSDNSKLVIIIIVIVLAVIILPIILAAVLYVIVSSPLTGPPDGPQSMGISITRTSDGTNWQMLVTSTPSGRAYTSTTLRLIRADGSTNLTSTSFSALATGTNGCSLQQASSTSTAVAVGDRILCRVSWYPAGVDYQISDGATLFASGNFRG
jgi:hypothetical protein